ncbi:MAG TPA: hypothetical protein VGT40_27010 [Methylomirabilota bacterium]|jgi:hypothetical protein|nr:hypothetical protein [Methylomirabilota bacterium]
MKQLAKESTMKAAEVLSVAESFFGPEGLGLTVADHADGCVTFEGGGGFVRVSASAKAGGSAVNVDTSEWEQPALRFLTRV